MNSPTQQPLTIARKWALLALALSATLLPASAAEPTDRDKDYFSMAEALKAPEKVHRLELKGQKLTTVPPGIGTLTNLTWLVLSGNYLTGLPAEICLLTRVEYLSMNYNKLLELPADIGNMAGVKTFRAFSNELTNAPPSIGNLKNMIELNLSQNKLTDLPKELARLDTLEKLILDRNSELQRIPIEVIRHMKGLKELRIASCGLTELPPEIADLENLEILDLMGNELTEIPGPALKKLTHLKTLHLNSNKLTTLPPEIGEMTGLCELTLHGNPMPALPDALKNLTGLKFITTPDISSAIKTDALSAMRNMERLYLQRTGTGDATGDVLTNYPNLKTLSLHDNKLTRMPPTILPLRLLQTLDLSMNAIDELPADWSQLAALESLDLSRNTLTALPGQALRSLSRLQSINLDRNALQWLPPDIGRLTSLRHLILSNNRLTSLPADILKLKDLSIIALGGNTLEGLPLELADLPGLTEVNLNQNENPFYLIPDGSDAGRKAWTDMKATIRPFTCGAAVTVSGNRVGASITNCSLPLADVELRLFIDGRPVQNTTSALVDRGEHVIEARCRIKENPFFYRIAAHQTMNISASMATHIETLIRQLGADKSTDRDKAQQELTDTGEPALPYLEKTATHRDPEIRIRVSEIIKKITSTRPPLPPVDNRMNRRVMFQQRFVNPADPFAQ